MTRRVVYHDCDEISLESIAAHADDDALHVRRADVPWPEGAATVETATVPSHRDPEFLGDLVADLNRIADPLRSAIPGIDLVEVALYEWAYAVAPAVHRAWVTRRYGGAALTVIGTADTVQPTLRQRASRALRLRQAQAAVRRVRATVGDLRRAPRRQPNVGLLLIDQYAHTARILAEVGYVASRESSVDVFAIGTDAAVAAACEPFVAAAALADGASRKAKLRAARVARRAGLLASRIRPFGVSSPAVAEAGRKAVAVAARHTVLVDDLIAGATPAAIATTSIVASSARSAALIGRSRSIPCAWVQHGILRTDDWKTRYVQDHFLCWGDRDRRKLIDARVDAVAVTVTGSSQFEDLGTRARATAAGDGLRVLYLPSRSGGNLVSLAVAKAMVNAVVAAVDRVPGATLTVKPHPGDTSTVFDDLGDRVTVAKGAELVDSVVAADVVVVATSTAGLEACALDRPVVALAFEGVSVADEYADYRAALIARDPHEVHRALLSMSDDAAVRDRLRAGRRALVNDMFDGLRPGSAGRCAAELVRLAGGSERRSPTGLIVTWNETESRWSADDGTAGTLPTWRDPEWRDQLGDLVDAAIPLLADTLAGARVLEAARYDWFHRLAPIAHRAWALEQLLAKGAADISWVIEGQAPAGLAAALRTAAAGRATIRVLPTDPRPLLLTGRSRRPARRSAWQKPASVPRPGCALFVEAFPRGASVSAKVAAHLPESLPVRCITTSPEIPESLSPTMLTVAASRRARLRAGRNARSVRRKLGAGVALLTDPATSPWKEVAPALAAGLDTSLEAIVDASRTATLVEDVIGRWKPSVVVSSTGAPAVVRAAAATARRSTFIQHGLLLLYRYRRHLCHDTFVVWGPADRRQLEAAGVPAASIHVCGPPQFDTVAARRATGSPRRDDKLRVLYLPSRTGGRFVDNSQAAAMLAMVIHGTPPWAELRVKPHPSDTTDLFATAGCDVVPRDVDALEEIIDADAVVIATSTVGVEAAALGRPVIVLGLDGVVVPEELLEYGTTTVVGDTAELMAAITEIRDRGDDGAAARAAMVDDMLGGLVPGAAARAAAVVAEAARQ